MVAQFRSCMEVIHSFVQKAWHHLQWPQRLELAKMKYLFKQHQGLPNFVGALDYVQEYFELPSREKQGLAHEDSNWFVQEPWLCKDWINLLSPNYWNLDLKPWWGKTSIMWRAMLVGNLHKNSHTQDTRSLTIHKHKITSITQGKRQILVPQEHSSVNGHLQNRSESFDDRHL